jgi:excisionase family DNA binding protein
MSVSNSSAAVTAGGRRSPRKFEDDGSSLTLSVWQAARAVGVGRDPFYSLIREGRVRVLRFGTRIRVPRAELEAFIAREAK